MTSPGDDHEVRITSLEVQVRELRQETAEAVAQSGAARVLAAGADKEVADVRQVLKVQMGLLNALHETQQEHTRRFDKLDARFDEVDARFGQVEAQFGGIDKRFGQVDARFDQVDARFARIDEQFAQVDRSFLSVQEQFVTVHAGIAQIVRLLTPGDATA